MYTSNSFHTKGKLPWKLPTRAVIGIMICLASIFAYFIQGSMPMAIVAMVESREDGAVQPNYGPRFKWSAYDESLVLGSYFWGYTIIGVFAGTLAERFGSRSLAALCMVITILSTALTPVTANHLWLVIIIQFIAGSAVAILFMALQELIAKWAPPEEKGKFLSAIMATGIGTVIDWSLSGLIIENIGWPFSFYIVAIALGLFAVLWYNTVFDSPTKHPRISEIEKDFILSRVKKLDKTEKPWPPFRAILSSIPFWALIVCHFGSVWGRFFFVTATPKYLTEVHNTSITTTGFLSGIPHLVRFFTAIFFGIVGDTLLKKKVLSPNAIRKLFVICSHIIPGLFLIAVTFVGSQPYLCVAFMTLALGFNGAMVITTLQNPHDLAPNFPTTIYGWMIFTSSTSGFIAPIVVAHFTQERSTQDEWFYIFLIGAAIYIISAIIFILFGSGRTQKWNDWEAKEAGNKNKIED